MFPQLIEIGVDWAPAFENMTHSQAGVFMKLSSVANAVRGKASVRRLLMMIPGPKEPGNLQKILGLITTELKETLETGIEVRMAEPAVLGARDGLGYGWGETRTFRPVFRVCFADTPGIAKVMDTRGATSTFHACVYCTGVGEQSENGRNMVYKGLRGATLKAFDTTVNPFAEVMTEVGDPKIRKTDAYYRYFGPRAADGMFTPEQVGMGSLHCFAKDLEYSDAVNSMVVPLDHGLLYNTWKVVLGLMLGTTTTKLTFAANDPRRQYFTFSATDKAEIHRRIKSIAVTHHFSSAPLDITKYLASATLEKVSDFVVNHSQIVFLGLLDRETDEMIACLRRFTAYAFYNPDPTDEQRDVAYAALMRYGQLVEKNFPDTVLRQAFHRLVCQLKTQEELHGPLNLHREMWNERGQGDIHAIAEGRNTLAPAQLIVRTTLVERKLREFELDHMISPIEQPEDRPITGPTVDTDPGGGASFFLGRGKLLQKRSDLGSKILTGLHRFGTMWPGERACAEDCPSGTCFQSGAADGPGRFPDLELLVYNRACIKSHFNMFSTSYKRVPCTSPSTMVTYHEQRIEHGRRIAEDFIFHSKCFVRATSRCCSKQLRFAYGDCLPVLDYVTGPEAGSVWTFAREAQMYGRDYVVKTDSLGLPICTATLKEGCAVKVEGVLEARTGVRRNRTYGPGIRLAYQFSKGSNSSLF